MLVADLDTVDDLEATPAVNFTDIAAVQPSLRVKSFFRVLLV